MLETTCREHRNYQTESAELGRWMVEIENVIRVLIEENLSKNEVENNLMKLRVC